MSAALRLAVRQRAGARCEYCQLPDLLPCLLRFHLEPILLIFLDTAYMLGAIITPIRHVE